MDPAGAIDRGDICCRTTTLLHGQRGRVDYVGELCLLGGGEVEDEREEEGKREKMSNWVNR